MSISGNPGSGLLSFSFAPPSHQATTATMVHTGEPPTISTRRRDGEEVESSSFDHTIPRVSVQPANIVPLVIPFSSGVTATSSLAFPYGNHTGDNKSLDAGRKLWNNSDDTIHLIMEEFIVWYNLESLQINGTIEALKVAGFIHGQRRMSNKKNRSRPARNGKVERLRKKGRNTQAPLTQIVRKSSVEAGGRPAYYHRDSGRYTPYTPREVSVVDEMKDERHETYPMLIKTPSEIWRTKGLKWEQPRPLKDNPARDISKYCDYHRMHDHDTNDCWHLKKQIEKFHSNGELKHLIAHKKGEKALKEGEKTDGKVIHEIYAIGGENEGVRLSRKRCAETRISWICTPLTVPTNDGFYSTRSFNITTLVGKYKMRRIFINTGSSSDILYEHTFRRMSWEDQQAMERVDYPVMGFSGERVKPMGKISLPVTIGKGRKQRVINLTFLIIKADTKHNAILGRTALGLLAAWVSTAQGAIVFPTLGGQMCTYRKVVEHQLRIHPYKRPVVQSRRNMKKEEEWMIAKEVRALREA
ncbi:hypothetical protein E3N88_13988 [Mikania micrantha]|uniref:Uncharacterized protein n=1 Tax=Mikania micrantha TaxID=192012 RepID=A0A5N6P1E1_9ASTR|nr:hypothetical protein E3N88_13988 [Mikania micrantha]